MGPTASLDGCGKSRLHRNFFYSLLSLCFIHPRFFVLIVLAFCLLSLLYNTQNTNVHAPEPVSNPESRQASRPRPRGHWDRQGFDPGTVQPVASCYTNYTIPACLKHLTPSGKPNIMASHPNTLFRLIGSRVLWDTKVHYPIPRYVTDLHPEPGAALGLSVTLTYFCYLEYIYPSPLPPFDTNNDGICGAVFNNSR